MLFICSVSVFFAVMLLYACHCWKVLYWNTKSLKKLLSPKAFLIFYLAARSRINNNVIFWMMSLGTTLTLIIVVGLFWLVDKASEIPGFDGRAYFEKLQFYSALRFDFIAMIISWLIVYSLSWVYFDKVSLSIRRIDLAFDDILNFHLVDHKLIDRNLSFRWKFYLKRRLVVKADTSKYSRRQFSWIYSIVCVYSSIAHISSFQKIFTKSRKEFVFSNGTTTLGFPAMLKFISDCFDRSAIDINLIRPARFSHAKQYLEQLEETKIQN